MSNWEGAARSNYFRVKDLEAFKNAMVSIGLAVIEADDRVMVHPWGEDGWPSSTVDHDDSVEDIDVMEEIHPHLVDGEVAVLVQSGHEKLRYIDGYAIAFNNTGKSCQLTLEDIYEMAERTFGVMPTQAMY